VSTTEHEQHQTEPDLATWNPAEWLAGSTATKRSVRIYSRGDLIAEASRLDRELQRARSIPEEDRAANDPTPEGVIARMAALNEEFEASGIDVVVEGRSEASREAITKALPEGVDRKDDKEVGLHWLAAAIVSPKGLDVEWLRRFREVQEAQFSLLFDGYWRASSLAPRVTLPFSGAGSRSPSRDRSSSR